MPEARFRKIFRKIDAKFQICPINPHQLSHVNFLCFFLFFKDNFPSSQNHFMLLTFHKSLVLIFLL